MFLRPERLSETVCWLLRRRNVIGVDLTFFERMTNKVISKIDVFGSQVFRRILCNCKSSLVV